MEKNSLKIRNLHVGIDGQEIIKGLNLEINSGEIHIIMGPNGSGKSTLCYALMGHPKYKITEGEALFNGVNILDLSPDKRAQLGLFLAFQYPREVPGVTLGNFLRTAKNAITKAQDPKIKPCGPAQFIPVLQKELELTKTDRKFVIRGVNEGLSGGEKKRAEILQMAVLQPKMALLDEIDSGLDIDALKAVANGIQAVFERSQMGVLLITHYQRILNHLKPHFVHIMVGGKIVKSGDHELAMELEKNGYENYLKT
ncbi:MAG: Fe-S cluster assembly ATPase SufC [Candidatus Gracilibacteria bacterium]|jgi:Fe-S cluster assembly ATP-binding protein